MTITFTLDHVSSSTEDVSVEVAEKSTMVLQSTFTDPKTSDLVSTYVLSTGDNSYPATVTYRISLQKRNTGPIRRLVCTFDTWATATDDVANTVVKKPISATASFNIPADMTVETADFDDLIGNLFSYLYDHVDTKVRDTVWLGKLLFGIPQVK